MATNRVTVPFDEDAQSVLDELVGQADKAQSEPVREALVSYAANFEAATTDAGPSPEAYHQILSSGKHVPLNMDSLYMFLDYVEGDDGEPAPKFLGATDWVTTFHTHEYRDRFESLTEFLDWLPFCDFPTVRASEGDTFHVAFLTEPVKWLMSQLIALSTKQSPLDIEVEGGALKVLLTEAR